jgi:3-methyladenine DNA glycosylase/8-oxoguanine DNA glycosylase
VQSHGLVALPPMRIDEERRELEATVMVDGVPRTIRLARDGDVVRAELVAGRLSAGGRERLRDVVRHVLRLDEDLSGFYDVASSDLELAWAGVGAARLVRSQSVFEEVVKTICTTNCAWSATERMVSALVEHLGEPAPGAPPSGPHGRAFPTPAAMAAAADDFYSDVARCGYRGPFLKTVARQVGSGEVDLEALPRADPDDVPDVELEQQLLELPGVGPYAAAHIMLLIGRYSRLVLDSWTRPKYAKLVGRAKTDRQIAWRFRRYKQYAGLAFWLFVTQDWVEEPSGIK